MKKFAVIGATGYVGRAVVAELAARGHLVTAFSRRPAAQTQADNVSAEAADVNAPDFAARLAGFDAVISAFNPGWDNPNIGADFKRGADAIVEAAKTAQVPYLLLVGGAGSLFVAPGTQLIDTPDFPQEIYDGADAARHLLRGLQDRRDVNWAMVSPPARLGAEAGYSEERTGRYRLGQDDLLMDGVQPAGISVADLAVAIADDAEQRAHLHRRFTVAAL
ncbi:NAD(P)H-binding protein [Neisseria leonii]|uniref:NAD(P)H-binding protein n=1 Tax=Neisseria leonii TaxID=2995413 RepID=A0A9X4E5C7_9NEIS|nr:NAD(P)H-binding protein [Neisseria sp. 51.81]MDD9328201.1 NAD(P)H-binding protein [Neisseria sp. 51.81]